MPRSPEDNVLRAIYEVAQRVEAVEHYAKGMEQSLKEIEGHLDVIRSNSSDGDGNGAGVLLRSIDDAIRGVIDDAIDESGESGESGESDAWGGGK